MGFVGHGAILGEQHVTSETQGGEISLAEAVIGDVSGSILDLLLLSPSELESGDHDGIVNWCFEVLLCDLNPAITENTFRVNVKHSGF